MRPTTPLRAGSLFSGIGALDLGLERAGIETAWMVENDPACRRVLAARFPDVPVYQDVTDLDWTEIEPVSLLAGGFPCQDISNAHTNGERRALNGPKSGLWRHYLAAIEHLAPRWIIVENVSAWRRWVPEVRSDLARHGYASVPLELPAGTFGAPHKRPRVFVVAHADGQGEPLRALDAQVARLRPVPRGGGDWRTPPPGGLRVDVGTPDGMDRCRLVGNAVAPAVTHWIGQQIQEVAA